jgi:hypothetical protein
MRVWSVTKYIDIGSTKCKVHVAFNDLAFGSIDRPCLIYDHIPLRIPSNMECPYADAPDVSFVFTKDPKVCQPGDSNLIENLIKNLNLAALLPSI